MGLRKLTDASEEPVVLTVAQAAKLLQVSENHIYNLVSLNAIPHTRFGKLIRIPRWGLLQFIAKSSGAQFADEDAQVAFLPDQSIHVQRPREEEV